MGGNYAGIMKAERAPIVSIAVAERAAPSFVATFPECGHGARASILGSRQMC